VNKKLLLLFMSQCGFLQLSSKKWHKDREEFKTSHERRAEECKLCRSEQKRSGESCKWSVIKTEKQQREEEYS